MLLRYCTRVVYNDSDMDEYKRESSVRGYHVYQAIWLAVIGEVLPCARERRNSTYRYAVAVVKDRQIIGHLPRKISKVCSLFIRRGGSIQCTVTGGRRYSVDLSQGGIEIPCILKFTGKAEDIKKLKKYIK